MARKASQGGAASAGDAWGGWADLARSAGEALGRFGRPATESFQRMQGLLADLAQAGSVTTDDVVAAWRLELSKLGPLGGVFGSAAGDSGAGLFGWPPLGPAREQQKRWQALARAQIDYQQTLAAYSELLGKAQEAAHGLFKAALDRRAGRKEAVVSARELYELWIEAAETAWRKVAGSASYAQAYAALSNAQTRVKAGVQLEIEQLARQYGLPTRTEVDELQKRLHELEGALRALRVAPAAAKKTVAAKKAVAPKKAPAKKAAPKPGSRRR